MKIVVIGGSGLIDDWLRQPANTMVNRPIVAPFGAN